MKKYSSPVHQHQGKRGVKGPTSEMCDHQEKEYKHKKTNNSKSQQVMQHHLNQGHRHHRGLNIKTAEDTSDLHPNHQNQRDCDKTHHPHHVKQNHHRVSESTTSSTSSLSSSSISSSPSSSSLSTSSSSSTFISTSSTTSSPSSSQSSESSSEFSDRYRPRRPQHSQSFSDVSGKHKYFEEDDDTAPLINERRNLNKSSTKKKRDTGKSSSSCPSNGGFKNKQTSTRQLGNDGSFRKAKSMEDIQIPKDRGGSGEGNGSEQERSKSEARKNLLKEKMKFSAFLNEITRQVLSPMRLTSLGVTDAQRPYSPGQVSPRSRETDSSTDKPRQRRSRPVSPDSVSSSKHSHTSRHSRSSRLSHSKSFHHFGRRSSNSPSRKKRRPRSCHSWSPTPEHHTNLPSSKHCNHHEDRSHHYHHGYHHTTSHHHHPSPVFQYKDHHSPTYYNTSHSHEEKYHKDPYSLAHLHDKHHDRHANSHHHGAHHDHAHNYRDNYNASRHCGGHHIKTDHHDDHHSSGHHHHNHPNSSSTTPCHHEHHSPTSNHGDPQAPTHEHHHGDHHREAHHHHPNDHKNGPPHFHHQDRQHSQGNHSSHINQCTDATHHYGDIHKDARHFHHSEHHSPSYHHRSQHHHNKSQNYSPGHSHLHGDHKSECYGHYYENHHSEAHPHPHEDHYSPNHHHRHGGKHNPGHPHHYGDHHDEAHHHHHGDQHNPGHPHHYGDHHDEAHHHHHGDQHNPGHSHHYGDHHDEAHPHGDQHNPGHPHHYGDQHSPGHHHHHGDQHGEAHQHHYGNQLSPGHHHHHGDGDYKTSPHQGHKPESQSPLSHCKHNNHDNNRVDDKQTHLMEHSAISPPPHRKPESLVSKDSPSNTNSPSSQDDKRTSFTGSSSHETKTHEPGRAMILQDQNEGLHQSLLQTAVRMECLGEEFISSQKVLETELQRTRMELSNLMDRFKRLQDDCSSTQQTNSLLEQKLHSMLQNMEGERERLNRRISELTDQLTDVKIANTMEAINQMTSVLHQTNLQPDDAFSQMVPTITPPPAQFMDSHSYGKEKSPGQEQPLGSVPEEEESDWSEMGEETPQLILTGANRTQTWRQLEADMDKDSESGSEELIRRHSPYPLQIPHLQFTIHNEFLPPAHTNSCPSDFKNLSDSIQDEESYRITTSNNLKSAILIRSASLEDIPLTRHNMHKELRGTEAMMNLHHSADEATEDLDNEILHHWRMSNNRDTVIRRLTKGRGEEVDSSLAGLQSAEQLLKHLMCESSEAEVHVWTGGIPDEVLNVERTPL